MSTSVPYAIIESYSGKRLKFYEPATDEDIRFLKAQGFRRDGLGNQWYLTNKEEPQALSPQSLQDAIGESKHAAA